MRARLVLVGDVALGVVLFLLDWWLDGARADVASVALIAGPAAAAALAARRPVAALVLVWTTALLQVVHKTVLLTAWLALPFVAFRVARHGSRAAVWAAGLSVPAGAVAGVAVARAQPSALRDASVLTELVRASGTGLLSAVLVLAAVNAAPFALGLVVRVSEGYRRAAARAAAEHEIAQVRAAQTQLAYDVHDIVGHSLAVIIAQADAARLAAEDDDVRTALAQIAAAGRSSLAEVREVLSGDPDPLPTAAPQLDELIAGVRTSGTEITERVSGTPRRLDDAAAGTAYRVLQELLTNALKHGSPGGTVEVERVWSPHGLTLRVSNPVLGDVDEHGTGMGLAGVRSRVDALGGSLRTGTSSGRFVASAFLPSATS